MMRLSGLAICLVVTATPALAQKMNADAFHREALEVKAMGPLAIMSPRLQPLINEGRAANNWAAAVHRSAVAAKKSPPYCPPEPAKLTPDDVMSGLAAIPQPQRTKMTMGQAMLRIFTRKWPCKK